MNDQLPNANDLARKYTPEERKAATDLAKATQRNNDCPCGCGKKAKKCENGRRVLQFKKYLRGSVMSEVILAFAMLALVAFTFTAVMKQKAVKPEEEKKPVATVTVYRDTTDQIQSKP